MAKLGCGFIIVKSLDKYEQRYLYVSAIIVAMLLTRLPMKRGERPTVSVYIGVIIHFLKLGIITPNSTLAHSLWFLFLLAKVNKKAIMLLVMSKIFLLINLIKIAA